MADYSWLPSRRNVFLKSWAKVYWQEREIRRQLNDNLSEAERMRLRESIHDPLAYGVEERHDFHRWSITTIIGKRVYCKRKESGIQFEVGFALDHASREVLRIASTIALRGRIKSIDVSYSPGRRIRRGPNIIADITLDQVRLLERKAYS